MMSDQGLPSELRLRPWANVLKHRPLQVFSSNKKLLVTSATLVVTGALLVVTRSY